MSFLEFSRRSRGLRAAVAVMLCVAMATSAATLTGSFTPITTGSNVNLSAAGNLDWVHWGLYTDTSLNRKSAVAPQIGNFNVIGDSNGFVTAYQFADNANGYSWVDGAPFHSITNTTTGVWAYGFPNLGAGFEFAVPADTNTRTLQVFVGAFKCRGTLTATLSDGSAPGYTDNSLFNQANGPGGVYALTFAAGTTGQTLLIQWKLTSFAPGNPSDANVTLQAAALTSPDANNPPWVRLDHPLHNSAFAGPASIALDASAGDFDGSVTNVAFYSGDTKLGAVSTAPYTLDWSNVPLGRYQVTAEATDDGGATSRSRPVELFVYGTGGTQAGTVTTPPTTVDLTSEGSADWAHWGLVTKSSFNHKANVPPQISDITLLGSNLLGRLTDNYTAFGWSDGTPTPSVFSTNTGVFIRGVGNGFQITAPADTQPRQLRLYVGGYGMHGEFQAYLSDFSAPPYTDASLSSVYGRPFAVYMVDYAAASSGQQLVVNYRAAELFDFAYGNVTLAAATLQGGPLATPPLYITNATRLNEDFVLSFNTQNGRDYTVEFTESLPATGWYPLITVPGNGSLMTVTNFNSGSTPRFYRVFTP